MSAEGKGPQELQREVADRKLCARCGACCWLAHPCPSLKWDDAGLTYCEIHKRRTKNCRIFPIDEKDIADRNLILPDVPCGYSFRPKKPAQHG